MAKFVGNCHGHTHSHMRADTHTHPLPLPLRLLQLMIPLMCVLHDIFDVLQDTFDVLYCPLAVSPALVVPTLVGRQSPCSCSLLHCCTAQDSRPSCACTWGVCLIGPCLSLVLRGWLGGTPPAKVKTPMPHCTPTHWSSCVLDLNLSRRAGSACKSKNAHAALYSYSLELSCA